jgi:cytidyltransferase-like protein
VIIVLATGGFDPIHSGHIAYLNQASKLGDLLVVGLNSDEWLTRKKGKPFMKWNERKTVVKHLEMVDAVIGFEDSDDTACGAIDKVRKEFPKHHIVFVNGGDRTHENIPEMKYDDIEFVFGVGGSEKINSSSTILGEWTNESS